MIDFKSSDDYLDENNDNSIRRDPTVIKIVGCGGGGSSAVNRMIKAGVKDVQFIVINTDLQALYKSVADVKVPIGQKITGGLGAGGNPQVGEEAAKEDIEKIQNFLDGADMVFIAAGMGGGTGTGSAPVVAKMAHDAGILTVAVVTTPFDFEGTIRARNAQEGLKKLRENVDSLIVIPNEQIIKIVDKKLSFAQAFKLADDVLCQGIQGITEIITVPGEINLDFNDVKTVLKDSGETILGVGFAEGENRAVEAVHKAICNPLLENRTIDGANKIIINISGNEDIPMDEIQEIINSIRSSVNKSEDNIIFGITNIPEMGDKISVTVIATGFDSAKPLDMDRNRLGDDNSNDVVEFDDYLNLVTGSKKHSSKIESSESAESSDSLSSKKLSTISFSSNSLFADLEENSEKEEEENIPEKIENLSLENSYSNSSKLDIPSGYKFDPSDMDQPACYRRKPRDYPRQIDLSDN